MAVNSYTILHILGFIVNNPIVYLSLVVTIYACQNVAYAYIFSPVRNIPGPWWARLSRIPLLWATYHRRRSAYASELIRHYGPIVVIAPDQIHTTDEAAMKTIYARTSLKTKFYSGMGSWKGVTVTLGFLDYASAAPTRNNLLQCFQNRNLDRLVANISSHIGEFSNFLKTKAKTHESVDGIVVFRLLALDIVTDILWGEENTLLSQISEEIPIFLRRFHAFSHWNALKSFIPALDWLVRYFGTSSYRQLRNDCSDMDITAREALDRWHSNPKSRHEKDVLGMLQAMNDAEDPVKQIPREHIPAYMVEMLAAGSSTTSHTAAFVFHHLARYPDAQKTLQNELRTLFPNKNVIDEKKLLDLAYLDSVIRETMRLYPMIPGPLERHLGEGIEVEGLKVPPGVIASTSAWDQGRLEEVYAESEKWKPERWLQPTDRMKLNWIPFGYGCRSCPGANLVMTELKYIIGIISRQFIVSLPAGHENDKIELMDIFAAGAKSGNCWLEFLEARD
ncbi:putative cytochrome P450 [Xylogone sp. PMI_703]|nr:putative cytochrome P450 [Xylogone sp. PMI_703]